MSSFSILHITLILDFLLDDFLDLVVALGSTSSRCDHWHSFEIYLSDYASNVIRSLRLLQERRREISIQSQEAKSLLFIRLLPTSILLCFSSVKLMTSPTIRNTVTKAISLV